MEFFVPFAPEGLTAQEVWADYLEIHGLPATTRPVRSVTYEKEGKRYVVTVGERRKEYAQKRGTRGGPDYHTTGRETGSEVTMIGDPPGSKPLYVWSALPAHPWASPSFVGRTSIREIEYFDRPEPGV